MPQELDNRQWWLDDSVWLDLFIPALRENSGNAERAAKLFHSLLVEIENNPQGAVRAIECLERALRLAFSFTSMYRTCHILFQASLADDFQPNLGSMERLTEAMRQVKIELRRASRQRKPQPTGRKRA